MVLNSARRPRRLLAGAGVLVAAALLASGCTKSSS